MSTKKRLKKMNWKRWGRNLLLFSAPALLALLTALQGGSSLEFALGAAYSAFLGSLIDLVSKFREVE